MNRGGDGRRGGPRVLIAGGGTGGHVYPGLAVAEALRALAPEAEIRWVGTRRGLESVLVRHAGLRLHLVPASGFRGLGSGARLRFLVNFGLGLLRSLWLLARWRPAVVLGTGGYVSAPVLAAARLLRLPTALQEQNALPGSANRLLGRWARRVYLGFAAAGEHFPAGRTLVTGNPVRGAFSAGGAATAPAAAAPAAAQPPPAPPAPGGARLLLFGGSRGARTLNRAAAEAAPGWLRREDLSLWLQTGPAEVGDVRRAYGEPPPARVRIDPYILDMPAALGWADLVVCRAGAMTLAELAASARPAVLVPFPHATDQHQLRNARDWERDGAAVVLEDAGCDGPTLAAAVDRLAADPERLRRMGAAAAARATPGAARAIAVDLLRLAGRPVAVAGPAAAPAAGPDTTPEAEGEGRRVP